MVTEGVDMSIASDLLLQHFETLVADNARWQTLIADEIVWELPYAPAIGHPERLSGREAVVRHVTWFLGAVEKFRFSDVRVHAFADPAAAVAELAQSESVVRVERGGGEPAFQLSPAGGECHPRTAGTDTSVGQALLPNDESNR